MQHWVNSWRKQSLILVVVGLLWVSLTGCGGVEAAVSSSIAPQTLFEQINTEAAPLILDVRTADEFRAGHVPGAVNVPIQVLGDRLDELEAIAPNGPIVVYCEQGIRAKRAETLLKAEFKTVRHLEGDMSQWRRNGFPITFPN
ncbi:MAG: rhodanese-like domain-containing protein [Leptolyngbyaceae cyanobacterium]